MRIQRLMHDELSNKARVAFGAGAALILAGVWLGKAWWFYALAGLGLVVAIGGARRCGLPSHVALAIGAAGLLTTGLAFANGPSLIGGIFAGLLAAGAFLAATLEFCVPCSMVDLLFEPRNCSADDDETVLLPRAPLPDTLRIQSAGPLAAHSTRA